MWCYGVNDDISIAFPNDITITWLAVHEKSYFVAIVWCHLGEVMRLALAVQASMRVELCTYMLADGSGVRSWTGFVADQHHPRVTRRHSRRRAVRGGIVLPGCPGESLHRFAVDFSVGFDYKGVGPYRHMFSLGSGALLMPTHIALCLIGRPIGDRRCPKLA
jgi:hypothetical protein